MHKERGAYPVFLICGRERAGYCSTLRTGAGWLLFHLLKIRSRMLADGTNEICRKLLTLIDVAADGTAPYGLAGLFGVAGRSRGLGLDVGVVVSVGSGGRAGQDVHILHGGDEEGVGAQIQGLFHLAADVAVGPFCYIQDTVSPPLGLRISGKLVRIPAGLEAEPLEDGKIRVLT